MGINENSFRVPRKQSKGGDSWINQFGADGLIDPELLRKVGTANLAGSSEQ